MQTDLARYAAAVIAFAAILGFLWLYGRAICKAWANPAEKQVHGAPYVYVATVLAGLVGGVMAMVFNEQLPTHAQGTPAAPTKAPVAAGDAPKQAPAFGPEPAGKALLRSVNIFSHDNLLSAISAVYVMAYLLIGFAAIATWVRVGETNTSDLIKNIALIAIGLFLAITRTFFNLANG
jgi:hypothetical protein